MIQGIHKILELNGDINTGKHPVFPSLQTIGDVKHNVSHLINNINAKVEVIKKEINNHLGEKIEEQASVYAKRIKRILDTYSSKTPVSELGWSETRDLEDYYNYILALSDLVDLITSEDRLRSIASNVRMRKEVPSSQVFEATVLLYSALKRYGPYGVEAVELVEKALSFNASREKLKIHVDRRVVGLVKSIILKSKKDPYAGSVKVAVLSNGLLLINPLQGYIHFIPSLEATTTSSDTGEFRVAPIMDIHELYNLLSGKGRSRKPATIPVMYKGVYYTTGKSRYQPSSFIPIAEAVIMLSDFTPEAEFAFYRKGLVEVLKNTSYASLCTCGGLLTSRDLIAHEKRFIAGGRPLLTSAKPMTHTPMNRVYMLSSVGLLSLLSRITSVAEDLLLRVGRDSEGTLGVMGATPEGEYVLFTGNALKCEECPISNLSVLKLFTSRKVQYVYAPVYVFPVTKGEAIDAVFEQDMHAYLTDKAQLTLLVPPVDNSSWGQVRNLLETPLDWVMDSLSIVSNVSSEGEINARIESIPDYMVDVGVPVSLPILDRKPDLKQLRLPVMDPSNKKRLFNNARLLNWLSINSVMIDTGAISVEPGRIRHNVVSPIISVSRDRIEVYLSTATFLRQVYWGASEELVKAYTFNLASLGLEVAPTKNGIPDEYAEVFTRDEALQAGFSSFLIVLNDPSLIRGGLKMEVVLAFDSKMAPIVTFYLGGVVSITYRLKSFQLRQTQ